MGLFNENFRRFWPINRFLKPANQLLTDPSLSLFYLLLFLTGFLLLAEIAFSLECSGVYFGDFKLVANHLKIPVPVVLPGILFFLFAQLLVHVSYVVLIWVVTVFTATALNLSWKKTEKLGTVLWFGGLMTALLANRCFFPNSKFAYFLFDWMSDRVAIIVFWIFAAMLSVVLLLALRGFFLLFKRHFMMRRFSFGVLSVVVASAVYSWLSSTPVNDAATETRPNVIIIGIDSVRPDFLSFFGFSQKTPHLDSFLDQSTVFSESLTALARTYPSWVSILTGLYPKINNARTNLIDPDQLDLSVTLPTVLQQNGYKTIFATDETRFSNIDTSYGFDETATTPIGFNDFLLGSVNDYPLSNLIINTAVGRYLFPNSYGNRAVFVTYDPDSFINYMRPVLSKPRTKPALLIVHFCLPHFPYAYARMAAKRVELKHYEMALLRADRQFQDFMDLLKQDNFLNHSVVVLLSDHGEGVEIPGDRATDPDLFIAGKNNPKKIIPKFFPATATREQVNMSGGHGTDVLGLPQYHTLLAFRTYGIADNQQKIIPGLVSLMDIKPTVLDMLGLPLGKVSGYSLKEMITGTKESVPARADFFTESDFSPEAVRSVHPEERKVLFEGIDYFAIDQKTARVIVRDSMLKMIISSKQYADFYGPWVLGLYPQNQKDMMPILVNLDTGFWTNDLGTSFAKHSPAKHMLTAMKKFFGGDISTVENQK